VSWPGQARLHYKLTKFSAVYNNNSNNNNYYFYYYYYSIRRDCILFGWCLQKLDKFEVKVIKEHFLNVFDENGDNRIDIREVCIFTYLVKSFNSVSVYYSYIMHIVHILYVYDICRHIGGDIN